MNISDNRDKDYIIKLIQFLQLKYGIVFFITPKDFDMLYKWSEKRIPLPIIKDSIATVVKRREEKNSKVTGFSCFAYEVKKNFDAFLQLRAGSDPIDGKQGSKEKEQGETVSQENEKENDPVERFFNEYPVELNPLRDDFEQVYRVMDGEGENRWVILQEKLLALFKDDSELNIKTEIFLKNIASVLRKPEIEARYRLNYILNKFHIPDFGESR